MKDCAAMSTWDAVLEDVHQHHPFLCTMRCSQETLAGGSTLPRLVRITAAGVLGLSHCPPASLLTVVVPRLHDTAFWVAFMAALEGMRGDYVRAAAVPHSFKSGDILLLDSEHVVEFDEEKQDYLWFWTKRSSNTRTCVKLAQRLRLQQTTTSQRVRRGLFRQCGTAAEPAGQPAGDTGVRKSQHLPQYDDLGGRECIGPRRRHADYG